MSGRVGDLSQKQEETLTQFRERIEDILPSSPRNMTISCFAGLEVWKMHTRLWERCVSWDNNDISYGF
uniref:Uncharacterized protein n=1 Tax=Anguilla anguilla TaxID=7936 RepID=A0A0E9V837_ANGAN